MVPPPHISSSPLYAYSLAPVASVALLLSFAGWRHRKALGGYGLFAYSCSIALWCMMLMLVFFGFFESIGQRFISVGAFTAASYLHTAYDYTRQKDYRLVGLAYAVALTITILGAVFLGVLHDPLFLTPGPAFWPAMILAVVAAAVPSWTLWTARQNTTGEARDRLTIILIGGLMCAMGTWVNAFLLSSGRVLPYGMLMVLASLLLLARAITLSLPLTSRKLLDQSILFSSLMAFMSAGFLFGILSAVSGTAENLIQQYRLGALFLFCMAAIAFEPFRQLLRTWIGQKFFGDKIQTTQLTQHIESQAEKLEHAERLAQLGILTSAIAHEVRNPLGVLKAQLKLLELQGTPESSITDMRAQIERASSFVDDLLLYGRPKPLAKRDVDIDALLSLAISTAAQGRAQLASMMEIQLQSTYGGQMTLDHGQILQLLVILLDNAILANANRADDVLIQLHAKPEEDHLLICVEDNGPGIQPALADTLFEPFVTGRKREGEQVGTGLGLAIAQRIALRHHGALSFRTSSLGGACFELVLPLNSLQLDTPK